VHENDEGECALHTATGDPSRAREGRHRVPDRAEQVRLTSTLGVVLRLERGHWTQQQLADAAGLDRRTVDRLENGQRRPSTVSVWKIARALRPGIRCGTRLPLTSGYAGPPGAPWSEACASVVENATARVDSSKMRAKVWSLTHLPMRA